MKTQQDFYHTAIADANKIVAYTAVSDFNTLGIDLRNFNSTWTIQISRSLTTGTPTVTIECSDNNTDWDLYQPESTLVSVTTGETIKKNSFEPRYLRIAYVANSATGTITMKFTR